MTKVARVVRNAPDVTTGTAFDQLEASGERSKPREYATISYGSTNHYISFADRDLVIGGVVYTATAASRGELTPAGVGKQTEMTITLPIDHAFCRRYVANGIPPKVITCTVSRQQADLSTQQIWNGNITSMSVDDDCTEASFRIRPRAAEQLLRVLPTVSAGRMCPYVWGDTLCGVDPLGTGPTGLPHRVVTTVFSVNGREVHANLASIPAADPLRVGWATNGYLKHVPSGEIMTVLKHEDPSPGVSTLAYLTLDALVYGMNIGDSIEVYAGCPRTIVICSAKFANKQRYGGDPQLPRENPMAPASFGVVK